MPQTTQVCLPACHSVWLPMVQIKASNIGASGNTLNLRLVWDVFAFGLTAIKTDFLLMLMLMLSLANLCKSIAWVV